MDCKTEIKWLGGGIQELKEEVHTLRELNQLYIAEQNNDTQAKADIFSRFGLPHILK